MATLAIALLLVHPGFAAAKTTTSTLRIGMVQFPADLHPTFARTAIKNYVLSAAHRPMTGFKSTGEVICLLCTEVPSLANGRARIVAGEGMEVTFTLRDDLHWADGVRVTARDFLLGFEIQSALAPLAALDLVEAIDDRTIKLHLNAIRHDFDQIAPTPIPEHLEGPIFRAAGGALEYARASNYTRRPQEPGLWMGPYRVDVMHENDQIVLASNSYWKGPKTSFDLVSMRLIANTSALEAQLLARDVDMVARGNLGLTLDQHLRLKASHADRFVFAFELQATSVEQLTVQLDNVHLAHKHVRQAIMMAIDRREIAARLFADQVEVAHTFRHPSLFGFDPSVRRYPHDIAAARTLLAELGYRAGSDGILVSAHGERFTLELTTTAGNRARELVQIVIAEQLHKIGIEAVIRNQPARVLFGETLPKRRFKGLVLFEATQPLGSVPIHMLHASYVPSAANNWIGFNFPGYRNGELDKSLGLALAALEPEPRRVAWRQILTLLAEDLPRLYLYFPATAVMTPKGMTGIANPERFGPETLWIEQWQRDRD